VGQTLIDLKKEHLASVERPRYKYSVAARVFFAGMDVAAGKATTYGKAKLLELLACIPYREWEARHYARLTRDYRNLGLVKRARQVVHYGREAQDNEYWHLLAIHEKMKEDGLRDPWYLTPPIPLLMVWSYVLIARTLSRFSMQRAFLFNAEFEDHAEHSYAQFVADHPELDNQPVNNAIVNEYGALNTWGDVFRRICLDERNHRNASFAFCGKPEHVVEYEGMPPLAP
jgi:hypothetical protein